MTMQKIAGDYFLPKPPPSRETLLDQAAFLRLLSVQMSTQNPLEPMNDRDFFAQLAQLGTVQGVDAMTRNMQIGQGAALIGRRVDVFSPMSENGIGNGTAHGYVEAVEVSNQKVYIRVDGVRHEMNRIVRIYP